MKSTHNNVPPCFKCPYKQRHINFANDPCTICKTNDYQIYHSIIELNDFDLKKDIGTVRVIHKIVSKQMPGVLPVAGTDLFITIDNVKNGSTELAVDENISLMSIDEKDEIKLPRLKWNGTYTTGDAQDWTFEYTIEDLAVAYIESHSTRSDPVFWSIINAIFERFPGSATTANLHPLREENRDVYDRIVSINQFGK